MKIDLATLQAVERPADDVSLTHRRRERMPDAVAERAAPARRRKEGPAMNRREKALLGMIGLLSVLFRWRLVRKECPPAAAQYLEQQKQEAQESLRKVKETRSAYLRAESYLKQAAARSFGTNTDLATAQAGHMLTEQLSRLGLPEANFNFQPVPTRKIRGGQETGWSVQGEGPLGKMIDLLFVLEQTPQLHKIENLVISREIDLAASGRVSTT